MNLFYLILLLILNTTNLYNTNHEENHSFNSKNKSPLKKVKEITLKSKDEIFLTNIKTIKTYKDKIYVLDSRGKQIVIFDNEGNSLKVLDKTGRAADEFLKPIDIDISKNGNLFVLDYDNSKIIVYDNKLNFIKTYRVIQATKIAVSNNNNDIFLYNESEIPQANNNIIYHYNFNGKLLKKFSKVFWDNPFNTYGGGQLYIDNNNLYISNISTYLIKKINLKNYNEVLIGDKPKFYQPLEYVKGKLPTSENLQSYTPFMNMVLTTQFIVSEIYKSKPAKRWLNIYNKQGKLINTFEVNFNHYLIHADDKDNLYILVNPDEENLQNNIDVPDYKLILYRIIL